MTLDDIKQQLAEVEESFEELFEESIDLVSLQDKTLKEALKTQLPLQLQLEVIVRRLFFLYDQAEIEMDESYSIAIAQQMKNSYRDITFTQAREYAKADPDYKSARQLLAKIRKTRDEAKGCLEVVNSRKYTLNNLTNSIIAGVENTIL